jgi:hypothetical protein
MEFILVFIILHILENLLTDGGEVRLTTCPRLVPRKIFWYPLCYILELTPRP